MGGSGGEWRMVEVGNFPRRRGCRERLLQPWPLGQPRPYCGAGVRGGVVGAVEREEIRQAAEGKRVIARRSVFGKEKIIQINRQVAAVLRPVAVVVAEAGMKGNMLSIPDTARRTLCPNRGLGFLNL